MYRLLLVLFLLSLRSDAVECDWAPIEKDPYGCVNFFWYRRAEELKCTNMPECFTFGATEKPEQPKVEPPKKKEFFTKEVPEEKKKIIPILDNSAVALLKNSKLKDIKIIFYNKDGKLSKEFQKEAEKYLLQKGVKRDQFKIEIR
jgi:hypothetical protein